MFLRIPLAHLAAVSGRIEVLPAILPHGRGRLHRGIPPAPGLITGKPFRYPLSSPGVNAIPQFSSTTGSHLPPGCSPRDAAHCAAGGLLQRPSVPGLSAGWIQQVCCSPGLIGPWGTSIVCLPKVCYFPLQPGFWFLFLHEHSEVPTEPIHTISHSLYHLYAS